MSGLAFDALLWIACAAYIAGDALCGLDLRRDAPVARRIGLLLIGASVGMLLMLGIQLLEVMRA